MISRFSECTPKSFLYNRQAEVVFGTVLHPSHGAAQGEQ